MIVEDNQNNINEKVGVADIISNQSVSQFGEEEQEEEEIQQPKLSLINEVLEDNLMYASESEVSNKTVKTINFDRLIIEDDSKIC